MIYRITSKYYLYKIIAILFSYSKNVYICKWSYKFFKNDKIMRKLYLTLICLIALAASQASMAQNMTQLEAIKNLTGFWTTIPTDNVPQSTLNFENHSDPAQRYLTTTGFASKSYDYWSIHTNTYNFSTGVIQATNSDPSLNDNYNYRNLTPRTCEFRINGCWVNAQKGRTGQQTTTPVNNNRPSTNVVRPANNNRPTTNVVRPANNNNNNYRPTNNNNNGQYKDGSDLQLTTPPDVPATLAPSNNNARPTGNTPTPTNNNSQTQTENNNGRIAVDNNHTPPANSNNNVRIVIDNNYTPPTHNKSGQGGRVKQEATTPDSNTDNNSNNNNYRRNRSYSHQTNSSSNKRTTNPVRSRRSGRR